MAELLTRAAVVGIVACLLGLTGAQVAAAQWSLQSIPSPPGGGELYGISCPSNSNCIAVGLRFSAYGHPGPTGLIESWNGTQWTFTVAPQPRGASLNAVSCLSSVSCTAVGASETRSGEHTLVESWNGTRWKVAPNPASALRNGWLDGVSCVSRASCTAVGYYHHAGGGNRALTEGWNGRSWKVQANPASARRNSVLTGVSCVSRSSCTAVGTAGHQPLIETWNGTGWTIQPNGGGGGDGLLGVSCPSTASCGAVGAAALGDQTDGPFAESWDGSSWSVAPSASPSNTTGTLSGVSCPSSTACTAVGEGPLAEAWDGSSWSTQTVQTTGKSTKLTSVSCPSTRRCIAAGGYIGNGYKAYYRPLAEMWTS